MRTPIKAFLVMLVLGLVAIIVLPWWGLALAGLVAGAALRPRYPGSLLWSGLLAGGLLWGVGALYFDATGGSLPTMIAQLFSLGSGIVIGFVVALIGGITCGLGALVGAYLHAIIQPPVITKA